jgi:hypothetical protein
VNDAIQHQIEHARMRCVHAQGVPYCPPCGVTPPIPPHLDEGERDALFVQRMDEARRRLDE